MSEEQTGEPSKTPITEETKEWSPELDTALPINGLDIPNFKAWINWNGFQLDRETGKGHDGFDFAAYLTTDNRIVFGLPPDTPIRAVADGEVIQILDHYGGYATQMGIEHGEENGGMGSFYVHVKPLAEIGKKVRKGDIIGTLYVDPGGDEGRLVHVHLRLVSAFGTRGTSITGGGLNKRLDDPKLIDPDIYKHSAMPQGSSEFKVEGMEAIQPQIANFKTVKVN